MKKIIITESQYKRLFNEQNNQQPSIGYVIKAGASDTPMRTKTLNANQKYPLPQGDIGDKDVHMYEITLSAALNKLFDRASVGNKLDDTKRDQILFGSDSIINKGTIIIPVNDNTLKQKIRVSGNGALVLDRAANEYQKVKKSGGVIILELGASELYSNIINLQNLGISKGKLISKLNSGLKGVLTRMNNENGKKLLDPNVSKYGGNYLDNKFLMISNTFKGDFSNINQSLQNYYGKYDSNSMGVKKNELSKVLYDNFVVPSMDTIANGVNSYINKTLTSLPENLKSRLMANVKQTTDGVKQSVTTKYIANKIDQIYTKHIEGTKKQTPKTKVQQSSQQYKQGRS